MSTNKSSLISRSENVNIVPKRADDTKNYDVFEVFVQYHPLDFHVHVGSVVAPSPELGLQVARENFLRREKAINIWVVRQNDVHASSYADEGFYTNQEFDRKYRNVSGYTSNAPKWKAFKEKALTIEEVVEDVRR